MNGSGISNEKDREQASRIEELRNELNSLSDGKAVFKSSSDITADILESNLEDVIAFESVGSGISLFEGLQQHGMKLQPPDKLNEFRSARKVMEIFRALEELRIFLIGFEEMNARELYSKLWHQTLWEGCYVKKRHPGAITLIDVSHKMRQSDIQQYLDDLMMTNHIH
jgi:hypothetical protein